MGESAWELIDFQNKVIRIPPEVSKTGEYRTINIQPNLAEWLKPYAKKKALIVMPIDKRVKAIRKEFALGHDVLRHTFITFHVAKFKSVGATSLQAGNSEAIVRRHYLKMVADNEAKQFWGIKPDGA
jgi:integrase